jgi:N-acetylglucosamine-6-phosphate deacetylase
MSVVTGRSIFSGQGVSLTVRHGLIQEIQDSPVPDDAPYISPGFFDMQVNGYAGDDYNNPALSPDHIEHVVNVLASSGTSRHIPTLITNSQENIVRNLRTIARALDTNPDLAAAIPGIHVEGPYISEEDGPRGAHDPLYIRDPSLKEFAEWQEASGGRVRMITLAPERKGALDFIAEITQRGVVASIGHTAGPPELIPRATAAGARCSTHLGNGSHGLIPRLRNYLWEQLAEDRLYAGVIADGHHLPPAVVKVIARVKSPDHIILASDAAVMGGMSPGVYKWGNIEVRVFDDGHLGLADTEYLAGAADLLDWDLAQFMNFTGAGIRDAVRFCTVNPCTLLGIGQPLSEFEVGMPANLTLFTWTPGNDRLIILKTILMTRTLFDSGTMNGRMT